MQEDDVLVSDSLLGWAKRQDDSRPALAQSFVKRIELVEAALALPLALDIAALHHVHDVAMEVLWVTNGELERFSLSEQVALLVLLLVDVGLLDGRASC